MIEASKRNSYSKRGGGGGGGGVWQASKQACERACVRVFTEHLLGLILDARTHARGWVGDKEYLCSYMSYF